MVLEHLRNIKRCGAKCRTKGGAPCQSPAMKNGRCRMHGGMLYKREKHGQGTLRARKERKEEGELLKEMKEFQSVFRKELLILFKDDPVMTEQLDSEGDDPLSDSDVEEIYGIVNKILSESFLPMRPQEKS